MTLGELLEKLDYRELRHVVKWWGIVVGGDGNVISLADREQMGKAECIEYIRIRVASIDEVASGRALDRTQSTKVQISANDIPTALALCWLPQETIRRIATQLKLDVSNPPSTGIGGHILNYFSDYPNTHIESHWFNVARISTALASDKPNPPVSDTAISTKSENIVHPAARQPEQSDNSADVFHYIGFTVLGFLGTGLIAMFFTGGVPGLTGVAGILGAVGAGFLTKMYKDSQRGQPTPPPVVPRIEPPLQVVPPPEPSSNKNGTSAICPECGDTSPEEATHCISCGNKLPEIICPNCQTENISRAKFCMGCGQVR